MSHIHARNARTSGQSRILSWLQIMVPGSVSRDGKLAVIDSRSGSPYEVYLAELDKPPPILLGNGIAGRISPDNKWVISINEKDTSKIRLLPTGVGELRTIPVPNSHF